MTKVAVVGGGITGLAAAYTLAQAGREVTIFEAGDRLGGRILTEEVDGRPVDLGPDAFLARVPHGLDLCRRLGLADEIVHPAAEGAAIWHGGDLKKLPSGLVLGAPTGPGDLAALVTSGLLTPAGAARAALDLVLPATSWSADPTVGEVVSARLGDEVFTAVVDPLVGGIHAGPSAELSAKAAAPQLAAATASRSLMNGLREGRASSEAPLFASLRGGMGRLVERLADDLRRAGVTVSLNTPVDRAPVDGFAATVVTTPAPAAAALVSPDAAAELEAVEYASVALAVFVYPATALSRPLEGTGFLVPAGEGTLLTACSFGSNKWPHWAAAGDVVLRASAGRWGDTRALALDDGELAERLHDELASAVGLTDVPRTMRVTRWLESFPQYRPGHLDRVTRAEAALARDLPTVFLAGAGYRGVGIAACISSGEAAAKAALGVE